MSQWGTDYDWRSYVFRDVHLSYRAAISNLFGITLPQLFDGCLVVGNDPHFLFSTDPVQFRVLPVRIERIELVRSKHISFESWDDARIRHLSSTGRGL